MTRALLVGTTDYSHQTLEDMRIDLIEWLHNLQSVINNLKDYESYLLKNKYWSVISSNIQSYFSYSSKFFETSLKEIESIQSDLEDKVDSHHIKRIKRLGETAKNIYINLGKYWHEDPWDFDKDYEDPNFVYVENFYKEARGMAGDMIDLGNLASRLEDFEGYKMEKSNSSKSIFLSHSSKDRFFVRTLGEKLKNYGISVWIDEAEINIGDSLTEKIGKAIEECDYVGVILSANSITSEWVNKELQIALQKEIKGKQVVVLPILIEKVEIPPFLKDKLFADFTRPDDFEKELTKLIKVLGVSNPENIVVDNKPTENRYITNDEKTKSEIGLEKFEDIRIIRIDNLKSYKPDPNKALYNIYFELNNEPPSEWQQIFDAERRFPRHTMWRNAWIEGRFIIVYCVPDEIEKYHANDINVDVKSSNQKYRQYLLDKIGKEAGETVEKLIDKAMLEELAKRIKFD